MPAAAKKKIKKSATEASKKSDLTRQRILDAAAKIFAQRGYAHTRLADIAREANAHAGGIYYYFASREALVEEVLRISTERAIAAIRDGLSSLADDASTFDKLRIATITQLTGILAEDSYNVAFNKIYPQVPDTIRERHRAVLRDYFEIWRRIIRQGQAAGEVRPDLDAAVMRLAIVGSIQWAVEWAHPQTASAETLGNQMATLFFSGISTPEQAARPQPDRHPSKIQAVV